MSNLKFSDTHCHLDNPQFDSDRDAILKEVESKMELLVNIGYDLDSSKRSIDFAKSHKNIYGTVGIHPVDIDDVFSEELYIELKELASIKECVAIGEIGLDYHWMTKPKEVQEYWFRKQIKLAIELNKAVVIHTRDAMEDTISIVKDYPNLKGVFHAYPGSYESALEIGDNFYLGIGGVLTFKNAKKTVELIKKIDLNRVVIETDAPYLTPEPFRGQRNNPLYVEYVVKKIAELREMDYKEVLEITNNNAKKLYGISE